MLIGYNVVAIGASAFTAAGVYQPVRPRGRALRPPPPPRCSSSSSAQVLPKTLSINNADRIALASARPVAYAVGCSGRCARGGSPGAGDAAAARPVDRCRALDPHAARGRSAGRWPCSTARAGRARRARHAGWSARSQRADRLRGDGPPHQDAHHRCQPALGGDRAGGPGLALYPDAALARQPREYRRRAPRQGSSAGAGCRRGEAASLKVESLALETCVRAGHHHPA